MSGIISNNQDHSSGLIKTGAYDDNKLQANIALLGFKMAVNGSLAKYNLVDQTIDEFVDTTGVDAGASTNEVTTGGYYYGGSSVTPSVTQDADAVKATGVGKNPPQDFFTGKDLYPEYVQNAAGVDGFLARYKSFSKYMWNNAGGLMFYQFDSYYEVGNQDNIIHEIEAALNFPIFGKVLGRFVKVSDSGMKQSVWDKVNQVNINEATAKVIIDKALNRMIEEDGRVDMSKLTPREQQAILIDTGWFNRYNRAIEKSLGNAWMIKANSLSGKALQEFVSETLRLQNEFNYNFDSKKE